MRISCPHCGHKSLVVSSRKISARVSEATCVCLSDLCGARFVSRVIWSHTLTPPAADLRNSLHEQIAQLPPEERADLFRPYQAELPFAK